MITRRLINDHRYFSSVIVLGSNGGQGDEKRRHRSIAAMICHVSVQTCVGMFEHRHLSHLEAPVYMAKRRGVCVRRRALEGTLARRLTVSTQEFCDE